MACCFIWKPELAKNVLKEFILIQNLIVYIKEFILIQNNLSIPLPTNINEETLSYVESYIGSMVSTNTSYTGGNDNNNSINDMSINEISKYLLETDYSAKKNPVKYEWKLMGDVLNISAYKIQSIDDYTDNDILYMINKLITGLNSSIQIACNVFVLLAQYRIFYILDDLFIT